MTMMSRRENCNQQNRTAKGTLRLLVSLPRCSHAIGSSPRRTTVVLSKGLSISSATPEYALHGSHVNGPPRSNQAPNPLAVTEVPVCSGTKKSGNVRIGLRLMLRYGYGGSIPCSRDKGVPSEFYQISRLHDHVLHYSVSMVLLWGTWNYYTAMLDADGNLFYATPRPSSFLHPETNQCSSL